jgi:hypothetical protein
LVAGSIPVSRSTLLSQRH